MSGYDAKAQILRKYDIFDYIKLNSLYMTKYAIKKVKRWTTEWKKIFAVP